MMATIQNIRRVQKAFSASASRYDALTGLQENIGNRLIEKIERNREYSAVLDVGMGTGRMTQKLAEIFPAARVTGIDFSDGMVRQAQKRAQGFRILQADAARLPFRNKSFDLIVSNVAYQWVIDLPAAFQQAHDCLKNDGIFVGAIFGRDSLKELFESMSFAGAKNFNSQNLAALADVRRAIAQTGLVVEDLRSEWVTVEFPEMWDLLLWLKKIGANGVGRNGYLGKELIFRADAYYQENYKTPTGIKVTFEVIWLEARRE